MAGEPGSATEETMHMLRQRFGLDLPVLDQLTVYLTGLCHGSLGFSPRYNLPVATLIGQRLPGTLLLMTMALAIALLIGVAIGSVMALNAGRWLDRVLSIASLVFYSVPGFWIGLMLIVLFSVELGWLPSGGAETIGAGYTGGAAVLDRLWHMVLPATSLALFYVAIYARLTRAAVLEVASQDFVRTASAKGLSPVTIAVRHILRNALLPVTTLAGMHFGGILGGAVVVETVYSWPGLGRLAFEAVMGRDFHVLLGILLLSSLLVIIVNMAVDLIQAWLDPRIAVR
jgi:peptide/nickel transport system permease protein